MPRGLRSCRALSRECCALLCSAVLGVATPCGQSPPVLSARRLHRGFFQAYASGIPAAHQAVGSTRPGGRSALRPFQHLGYLLTQRGSHRPRGLFECKSMERKEGSPAARSRSQAPHLKGSVVAPTWCRRARPPWAREHAVGQGGLRHPGSVLHLPNELSLSRAPDDAVECGTWGAAWGGFHVLTRPGDSADGALAIPNLQARKWAEGLTGFF